MEHGFLVGALYELLWVGGVVMLPMLLAYLWIKWEDRRDRKAYRKYEKAFEIQRIQKELSVNWDAYQERRKNRAIFEAVEEARRDFS